MARVISESDATATLRTSWRIEIFCEPGEETILRAHRASVVIDKATGLPITYNRLPKPVITRILSDLPAGPKAQVSALAALFDAWEIEDEKGGGDGPSPDA